MKHFRNLFVLSVAVALVVSVASGLLAGEAGKISEDIGKININQASAEKLLELKYIGPEFANRIVHYRTEHGPFERAEDIMRVRGIGQTAWEANKDRITVE